MGLWGVWPRVCGHGFIIFSSAGLGWVRGWVGVCGRFGFVVGLWRDWGRFCLGSVVGFLWVGCGFGGVGFL